MVSMVPPVNDGTTGVCWGGIKINWNSGYQLYQAGTNIVMSELKYQGIFLRVPSQDAPFDLILWCIAKTIHNLLE